MLYIKKIMISKTIQKKKSASKKSTKEIVRIVIDDYLNTYITKIQKKYPLLSVSEVLKLLISSGINSEFELNKMTKFNSFLESKNKNGETILDSDLEESILSGNF